MGLCGSVTCSEFFLGDHTPGEAFGIIAALLMLEAVLSFDNAAILAAMVRRLPVHQRRKALLYGLVGAYVLRVTAILLAAFLIKYQVLKLLGGAYLVFLFVKHFADLIRHKASGGEHHFGQPILVRLGVPMLLATIIQIELIDLAFAIDQVIVAVGFTDVLGLIIIAACIGILFLRLAAAFMARVMDWLPLLEHMAYIAVGFVGAKLVLLFEGQKVLGWQIPGFNHGHGYHIPDNISLILTFALFVVPVVVKLLFKWPPSEPGSHEAH